MQKAVFLDRDGVVNEDVDHLNSVSDLHMIPSSVRAIKQLNDRGYIVVLVTNQGGIAKGIIDPRNLEAIHAEMTDHLTRGGARLDGIYFCPHHPQGTIAEYAIVCDCRKPKAGLIYRAAKDLEIDLSKSFLVGDKLSDIVAGKTAGVKTILVNAGHASVDVAQEVIPDIVAQDLLGAVQYIS